VGELLAHLVGDYLVQSDWMANEKLRRHGPALLHAASYTMCFVPITRNWRALVVIGGTHFVIDRWRLARHVAWASNQPAPARFRPPHTATGYSVDRPDWLTGWLLIITDNTMHLAINRWALSRWAGR
jgi:hypothetical protein